MRVIKKTIWIIFFFGAIFYALPATLLQIPYFQKNVADQIASYLKKKLDTEVHIRQIEFGFFNKLILKDVYLEDQAGDTLFQAKRVAAGFEFVPLLQKKWRFNSIQLFTFHLNLNKETDDSPLNIQYIIDAFAKQDTTSTNDRIDLQIRRLNIRFGNVSYRVKNAMETPGRFNPKSLLLSDISSRIHINNLTNKELNLQFGKLSFKDYSGLQVKNMAFDLTANNKMAIINQLIIELDKSFFLFTDINAEYNPENTSENDFNNIAIRLQLKTSTVYPKELSAFIPAFSHFDDRISLEGELSGIGDDFTVRNFYFRYYNHLMISANADVRNVFNANPDLFYFRGEISESFFSPEGIERLANHFSQKPFELPKQIKQMRNVRFEGDINGSLNDLTAWGLLNTGVGNIQANFTLGKNGTRFIKGKIASQSLDLEKLMNNKDYGEMAFAVQVDAQQNPDKKFSGLIDATLEKFVYKGYTYNNLNLNGVFSTNTFGGRLNLDSPEGKITGEGSFVFNGSNSKFDFQAKVAGLQLDKLNFTSKYKNTSLSFDLAVGLTGNNPDNLLGTVALHRLQFESDKGSYFLDSLRINARQSEQEKLLRVDSKILKGEMRGNFSFQTMVPALKQTFAHYLPSLVKPNNKYVDKEENNFSIDLWAANLTELSKIFDLPFSLQEQTNIQAQYGDGTFCLDATIPHAVIAGSKMDSVRIVLDNPDEIAQLTIQGISLQKGKRLGFSVGLDAAEDQLNTTFHWGNGSSKYKGDLKLTTLFSRKDETAPLRIETNIRQTDMVFNDSIWTLYPSILTIDSSNIRIRHLKASHREQFLKINGVVSRNPDEQLRIELNRMDLEYIFQSLNIPALEFGGLATGFVNAQDIYRTRKLETRLDVTDFAFNTVNFGNLDLTGTWDDENEGVLMRGKVTKNDSTYIDVDGIIYPVKEEISIDFDAKNADARFLRKYIDKVVQGLSGRFSGHLRLFGDLNNPTVEGAVFARNCRFGVEYLNTFYTFSDSVICLPEEIRIKDVSIYDERGNRATANGHVKHRLFDDFRFAANASYSNFMVFNAPKSLNPMFYGTAFGSGTVSLSGTEDLINIDVSMENTENTKITLNFMEEADVEDYDFIRFVSTKKGTTIDRAKEQEVEKPKNLDANGGSEIRLNLLLNPTLQATIEMIMDPVSGDKISGYGTGNIQIQYGTKTPLKVFGNYAIEQGKYNYSLQQFFYRNFDIQEGSSVAFHGDPYTAELAIKANYTVPANLGDLDPQLIESKQSARTNVPVNCILVLTGSLNHPAIAFDLDLPGATDELTRQVKSYIRTEDMMSRQIIYLLVLSRFYTAPEYMREDRANNDWSLLTSTLSTQLSSLLGSLSNNFQIGTVFHQSNVGEQTNTEFEFLLSSHLLNNRLIINGNFGYINNPYTTINEEQGKLPLIGDFDLEYKLTKIGDIRLKGFNRYNYRNFYSITPEMTQGIGILFRKDFNRFWDLFRKKYRQPATNNQKSENTNQ